VNVWLDEFNKQATIAGFKNVRIKDVDEFFHAVKAETENACVQFFDASLVAGWEHLFFAALNALNAFKGKVNISNSLAIETLLYASAQRQIKEAVKLMGIKTTTDRVVVLVLAENQQQTSAVLNKVSKLLKGERDDSVVELTDDKIDGLKEFFKISENEVKAKVKRKGLEKQAVAELVIEHMALLVTQR